MTHYAPLVALMVTLLVLTLILTLGKRVVIYDIPNERSLHTKPVPRVGGIALLSGVFTGWLLLPTFWNWWIMLPAAGLFMLSLADDVRSLSIRMRLSCHFLAALTVLVFLKIDWLFFVAALFFIAWMTNLYNFMDGSDGLAGGMTLFGFSVYGIAGLMRGDEIFAMANFTIAAAAAAFLMFNFHPARVFMGDAGSIPLGFFAGVFGVLGWWRHYWPFWFPLLVFSPFILDATVTLLKRAWKKEKLGVAHVSHYYQRLIQMNWGHRKVALVEYLLMLLPGFTALWAIEHDRLTQWVAIICWAAIFAALMIWLDARWEKLNVESGPK